MAATEVLTLPEYQALFKAVLASRGFADETVAEKFMLLLEETGEFAKAARKLSGIKIAPESKVHDLEDEAADVFILLIDLCNTLDIDLAAAVTKKESKNAQRTWK